MVLTSQKDRVLQILFLLVMCLTKAKLPPWDAWGPLTIWELGLRGPFGDVDPLNKAPFERTISRIKKGAL